MAAVPPLAIVKMQSSTGGIGTKSRFMKLQVRTAPHSAEVEMGKMEVGSGISEGKGGYYAAFSEVLWTADWLVAKP